MAVSPDDTCHDELVTADGEGEPQQPHLPDLHVRLRAELGRVDEQMRTLLDAMNDEILARAHDARVPREGEAWQDFVRRNARSFRAALLSYRDGARVHAGTEADPGGTEARRGE